MFQRISKYRNAVMGIAILWVLLHHSGLNLPGAIFAIKRSGYCGVDMFLFVSGLGCAVSLTKNSDPVAFCLRRFRRLYPHYIPVLAVFLILHAAGVSVIGWIRNILGNLTGFAFWANFDVKFNWYILAILTFYILTPLFFAVIKKYEWRGFLFLLALAFTACFCFSQYEDLNIGLSRFPIYIIGLGAGLILTKVRTGQRKDVASPWIYLCVYGGGIIGFALLFLNYQYRDSFPTALQNVFLPCILTAPAIICFLCQVFEFIEKNKVGKQLVRLISFIGTFSLDIYLIHMVSFQHIGLLLEKEYDHTHPHPASLKNMLIWFAAIVFIILVSFVYYKLIGMVEKRIFKEKKAE